jgi:hypothetical protein
MDDTQRLSVVGSYRSGVAREVLVRPEDLPALLRLLEV